MNVAPAAIEAEARASNRSDAEVDLPRNERQGDEVPAERETYRAVFFHMPILRLAKILLGATVCTMILNPPAALFSSGHDASGAYTEAKAAAVAEMESLPLKVREAVTPGLSRANSMLNNENAEILEAPATVMAPPTVDQASVTVPMAVQGVQRNSIVRSQKKMDAIMKAAAAAVVEEAPAVVREEAVHEAAVEQESQEKVDAVPDIIVRSESAHSSKGTQTRRFKNVRAIMDWFKRNIEPSADTMALVWSWMDATWHLILAAMILVGFIMHLWRRGTELLQSLPEFVVTKIPFAERQ